MYKASIYLLIDLENSKQNHVSISGGKATHNFSLIYTLEASTLKDLVKKVESDLGKAYDAFLDEGRAFYAKEESTWSDPECHEYYDVYFERIETEAVGENDLKRLLSYDHD